VRDPQLSAKLCRSPSHRRQLQLRHRGTLRELWIRVDAVQCFATARQLSLQANVLGAHRCELVGWLVTRRHGRGRDERVPPQRGRR